ncbi:MAG TPA: signal recognition particle-docking protein FtsY [bacterium]|nr:signal recognition particle-docking protein FtsY [bacterium]
MAEGKLPKNPSFLDRLKTLFAGGNYDFAEGLEETLISADIDIGIVSEMTEMLKNRRLKSFDEAKEYLKAEFIKRLSGGEREAAAPGVLRIIMLVGVNGAGKTTTAVKLALLFKKQGKKILLAAADTFRAAAAEQLERRAVENKIEIIKGMDGADPASVVFNAVNRAKSGGFDLLIIDTAGRLHTSRNLMSELEKTKRIAVREAPGAVFDAFIVIDANTGNNSSAQAGEFNSVLGLTGIVLTKLDSSARGGSVVKIRASLGLPVCYAAFGEKPDDIDEFSPEKYVEGLFG